MIGIQTLQHGTTFVDLARAWRDIDALGFESAWVMDHLYPMSFPSGRDVTAGCFESWTLLSALAPVTTRVRVGCLVTSNTLRNPALLAKMATTVDHATGGRAVLGLGAGWYSEDHVGTGIPLPEPGERIDRLAESVRLIRHCWSGNDRRFAGRFHSIAPGLPSLPRPLHGTIPLLVGGNSSRVMRIAARYADHWNMYAPTYDSFARYLERFHRYCAEIGRDPAQVRTTLHMPFSMARSTAQVRELWARDFRGVPDVAALVAAGSVVSGTVDEVVSQLNRYLQSGADGFILGYEPPFDPDGLELLAREVTPALASVG